jgi:glycosyltransferase involved in cell wall biosynthesis
MSINTRDSLRIAWLIDGVEGYGVRSAVVSLAKAVAARGHRPLIAAMREGQLTDGCRQAGLDVHVLNVDAIPSYHGSLLRKGIDFVRSVRENLRVRRQVASRVKQLAPDVLHVVLPTLTSVAGFAAREAGIPCFWEMPSCVGTGYPFGLNRRVYQWRCARYAITPLANSRYTADTLGDRPVKPVVFYLGADPARFDPAVVHEGPDRASLGIPADAPVIGMVARMTPSKGQHLVLEAMLSLGPTEAGLPHLVLLGGPIDDAFTQQLRDIAARAKAQDRLHILGPQPSPEQYYPVMDFAVSCRVDPEPFGLSVIEAMLMRKPVLVHALGGPAETVTDGVTGWHVTTPSVEAIAAGLRRAFADRSRWCEMGDNARRHALEHFTIDGEADHYLTLVRQRLADLKTG